jgi:hypothetical protein
MLAWMVYAGVVSTLLAGGAYLGERSALLRKAPTRWLWGLSVSAGLILPVAMSSVAIELPRLAARFGAAATPGPTPLRRITGGALAPANWLINTTGKVAAAPIFDEVLGWAWMLASAALLLAVAVHSIRLLARKRRWETARVAGTEVFVAEDVGPAVVGLWGPRIVVPRWLLSASPAEQALVIAHEQSHLEAGDAQVLAGAVLMVAAMPWNLPLWWCLRRLRNAIEVDCDARVLRRGHPVATYGAALIMVGARQSKHFAVVAGMSESKSFLEQRIRTMLSKRKKYALASAVGLACLGFVLAASAAEVSPPDPAAGHQAVAVDPKVLAGYVGIYKVAPSGLFTVTLDGDQLFAQLTGQGSYPIYPQSSTEFFYRIVNAQLTFTPDASGVATSVILHQNGANVPLPRIDAATADAIHKQAEAKQGQLTPSPGTEAAVRRMVEGALTGQQDYAHMSPVLAEAVRAQAPVLEAAARKLGPIQSIQFLGVDASGNDTYNVRQEHGVTHWIIAVDSNGITVMARVLPGP